MPALILIEIEERELDFKIGVESRGKEPLSDKEKELVMQLHDLIGKFVKENGGKKL